ncbi:plastocyanin/azurin family copper-binding protein [Sporosarcina sp. 179-K 3D1 HS]|uniref:cupredoxin domain-containing protein n=1 Tax=Sporosarcina sp. 179-K 3D1 HS TaxID=3232169 RepID=UPI0039A1F60B
MENYLYFVFGSLALLTIIVIILALIWKKKFQTMQGMIISMFFAMNVGLTAGVLLGVTYQGNLFLTTILSMAIGVFAGSICGLCFGILSVLEGFMAGIMGGMMGAMVGEMIDAEQSNSLIQIFLLLSFSTIFIIAILITPHNSKVQNKKWLLKPFLLSGIIAVYLIGGSSLAGDLGLQTKPELSSDASTTVKSTENLSIQKVAIETGEMRYSKNKIIMEKDKPVSLTLKNLDNIEHDIEIEMPFKNMTNEFKHKHEMKKNAIHLHATPNSMVKLTFTPTETGVYEYVCTVPGHKEFGMVGKLIVN